MMEYVLVVILNNIQGPSIMQADLATCQSNAKVIIGEYAQETILRRPKIKTFCLPATSVK